MQHKAYLGGFNFDRTKIIVQIILWGNEALSTIVNESAFINEFSVLFTV